MFFVFFFLVDVVRLSVPVQMTNWKDSSPKRLLTHSLTIGSSVSRIVQKMSMIGIGDFLTGGMSRQQMVDFDAELRGEKRYVLTHVL